MSAARDVDRVVERAIRFIRQRAKLHARQFALEVGDHLFDELYKGDARLFAAKGTWGREALTRIARDKRVDLSLDKLYMCIHLAILVRLYGKNARGAEPPDLTPWKWDRLWVLEKNPDAMVAVANWASRERIPLDFLITVSRLVKYYLEAGGKLDDLLVGAGSRRPDTPYKRMSRLLKVIERWLVKDVVRYPPRLRTRTLLLVDELLAQLNPRP